MATWSTNNFAGGMNDYLHPSLLDTNVAALLKNARIDTGKIVAFPQSQFLRAWDKDDYNNSTYDNRSVVKWYGRHYWSYNGKATAPYYGTDTNNYGGPGVEWDAETSGEGLGIPHCVYVSNEAISGVRPLVSVAQEGTENEDGLLGTYKYCVTLVDWNGFEGAPGSLTSYFKEIEVGSIDGNDDEHRYKVTISLTGSEIPANVRYAKVYRTINKGADFYFVGVLYDQKTGDENPDGLTDNSWSLTDDMSDSILLMRNPLTTTDYDLPPAGGKYLCENNGVFFLAVGSVLYFSVQDNPHAWPTLNYIGFDDTITGITPEFSGVLVFTQTSAWRVVGAESQETISRTLIPGNQGCVNYESISSVANAPIWVSKDGICLWNGESIDLITHRRLKLESPAIRVAVSAGDCYYLFLNTGVVVYDRRNGGVFYKLSVQLSSITDYAWRNELDNKIYLKLGTSVYVMEGEERKLQWTYRSPYIGGTDLLQRVYHQVVVSSSQAARLTVFLEGEEKLSVALPAGRNRVKLPLNFVGRWIQLEVNGQGEFSELAVVYGDA